MLSFALFCGQGQTPKVNLDRLPSLALCKGLNKKEYSYKFKSLFSWLQRYAHEILAC